MKRASKPNKNITAASCLLSVHSLLISNVFGCRQVSTVLIFLILFFKNAENRSIVITIDGQVGLISLVCLVSLVCSVSLVRFSPFANG